MPWPVLIQDEKWGGMGLAILNLIWKFYMEILNKAMSLFDVQVK